MLRIAAFFYSCLYTIVILLYGPARILRAAFRGESFKVSARLGRPPESLSSKAGHPTVWVHAVSVGEVNAVRALIDRLLTRNLEIWLSTTTQTGQKQARSLFHGKAQIFYFPLDWKLVCRRYLKRIQPDVILLVETEIWPNFVVSASRLKIPVVLVNGRISDQSFKYYRKFRFILQSLLACFSDFCMQSEEDLDRIRRLGAPEPKTNCTGNLKFDYETITNRENEVLKELIKSNLKNSADDILLVCGSTKPGEEELLLLAFESLRRDFDHLKLIIAPRHPHRGDEVTALVKETGFSYLQRSRNEFGEKNEGSTDILILDSIGELASLYEIADLVFIGGSLVPAGGQNVIEPAAYGKPILFGPHMENFRQVAAAFVRAGAAIRVENRTELETQLHRIISSPGERHRLGEKARSVVQMNRGAVKQTLRVVEKYLPQQNKN